MLLPPNSLLLSILLPLLASVIAAPLSLRLKHKACWLVAFVLGLQVLLLLLVLLEVLYSGPLVELYPWPSPSFQALELSADGMSISLALAMAFVCLCLALYSPHYVKFRVEALYGHEEAGTSRHYVLFNAFYPLFSSSLVGLVLAANLMAIWFFMELPLIPFYFITASLGYRERRRVAVLGFIWGTLASTFFLAGALVAYYEVGSFSISALPGLADSSSALPACLLMLLGLLIKVAIFGFHVWLPWFEAEPPTCIAGVLACYSSAGAYLVARVLVLPLPSIMASFSTPIMAWALLTMVYGALLSLAQDDVKRLCACSTISQVAYSLLGVISGATLGLAGGLFFLLSHCLNKSLLFSTAGLLVYETRERDVKRMGGLGRVLPATALLWALGAMALSAIPPFSTFMAEMVMFSGIFSSATGLLKLAIALGAVLATSLTAAYTFWPLRRIFMGQPRGNPPGLRKAPKSMLASSFLLALASAALGIWPGPVMDLIMRALGG